MTSDEKKALVAKVKKARDKKDMSLPIQIMESDLYDYNPGARMLLLVLALGTRTDPEAYAPDDCPYKDDMVGWCDMSQWRLALRVGKSESQVYRDIQMFRKDGVVQARGWTDYNKADHLMYRIVEDVVREHQRPAQKPDVERKPRYEKKAASRGWFSAKNQPKREEETMAVATGMVEDE